jgi:hypothetical protein
MIGVFILLKVGETQLKELKIPSENSHASLLGYILLGLSHFS